MNKIYRESVDEQEIINILRPMIKSYAHERLDGEHFGDFVIRKGIISATTEGKAFCTLRPVLPITHTHVLVADPKFALFVDDGMCPE